MNSDGVLIFLCVFFCLAALIGGLALIMVPLRSRLAYHLASPDETEAWAKQHNYDYTPLVPGMATQSLDGPVLGTTTSVSHDVIRGKTPAGHDFWSFVMQTMPTIGQGSLPPMYAWMVAIRLPRQMPMLSVTDKTFGDKVAEALGGHHVTVDSPAFNQAFHVWCRHPDFAKAFLDPDMTKWLLRQGRAMVPFHITDDNLIWSHPTTTVHGRMKNRLGLMDQMYERIPDSIWDAFGRPEEAD